MIELLCVIWDYLQSLCLMYLFVMYNFVYHSINDFKESWFPVNTTTDDHFESYENKTLMLCVLFRCYENIQLKIYSKYDYNIDTTDDLYRFEEDIPADNLDSILIYHINNNKFVYSSFNNNDRDFSIRSVIDSKAKLIERRIVMAEYTSIKSTSPITLTIPDSMYVDGNELLSVCFVSYILKCMNLDDSFDINYTISVVDDQCNITYLKSNEYLVLYENELVFKKYS